MHCLSKQIFLQVICDGQLLQVPHDIEGILLLNISSYMGGANLWASGRPLPSSSLPEDATQSHADGRLEVRLRPATLGWRPCGLTLQ